MTSFVYLGVEELVGLAFEAGPSMASRVGWLLSEKGDEWHVDEGDLARLESALGLGPYRLGYAANGAPTGWSAKWKLILPENREEMESWITRS